MTEPSEASKPGRIEHHSSAENGGVSSGQQLGDVPMAESAGRTACPNCGSTLVRRFCAECGQQQGALLVTVWDWLAEALDDVFSVDSTVFLTLKSLLLHPGELTGEWLLGRRTRFLKPLKLYLATAFVFFLVWSAAGAQRGFVGGLLHDSPASVQRVASLLPTLLLIVLVPYFALLLRLLFRRVAPLYSQHLVLALHFHSFLLCGLLLPAPFGAPLRGFVLLAVCLLSWAYMVMGARRVYGCSTGAAIVRSAGLLAVYALSFCACVLVAAQVVIRLAAR